MATNPTEIMKNSFRWELDLFGITSETLTTEYFGEYIQRWIEELSYQDVEALADDYVSHLVSAGHDAFSEDSWAEFIRTKSMTADADRNEIINGAINTVGERAGAANEEIGGDDVLGNYLGGGDKGTTIELEVRERFTVKTRSFADGDQLIVNTQPVGEIEARKTVLTVGRQGLLDKVIHKLNPYSIPNDVIARVVEPSLTAIVCADVDDDPDFKFMQQKPSATAVVISDRIDAMTERLVEDHVSAGLLDMDMQINSVRLITSEPVWVSGMALPLFSSQQERSIDDDQLALKLEGPIISLQGSESTSGGAMTDLDVGSLCWAGPNIANRTAYATQPRNGIATIFSGCILLAYGTNPSGRRFIAQRIITCTPQQTTIAENGPRPMVPLGDVSDGLTNKAFDIVIAAAPFAPTTPELSYDALFELVKYVRSVRPRVLLLVGPMLYDDHPSVASFGLDGGPTFSEHTAQLLQKVGEGIRGLGTEVLFTSSAREAAAPGIYPSPLFLSPGQLTTSHDNASPIVQVSDPGFLQLAGINFAALSTDILAQISESGLIDLKPPAVQQTAEGQAPPLRTTRITRILSTVLSQGSTYPLYPPHRSISLDFEQHEAHCCSFVAGLPQFLVCPSNLAPFVTPVNGVICINPGRLCKGVSGRGTFCHLAVDVSNIKALDQQIIGMDRVEGRILGL